MAGKRFWKLGIIGWPLGYSLSPRMHRAALKVAGLEGEYREIRVRPEDLENWLKTDAPKLDGFNVTMPHKEEVGGWIKESPVRGDLMDLKVPEAVNTVLVKQGRLHGHNTDYEGFLRPLGDVSGFRESRAVLLGAGGAAQAVAVALKDIGIGHLMIWNRPQGKHRSRAGLLAGHLGAFRGERWAQAVSDLSSLRIEESRLLVNATPMGHLGRDDVPGEISGQLHRDLVVYDLVYEPRETGLVKAARAKGCRVITGDAMLAAQGAESFRIWTGVPADQVLPAMKKALDGHFAGRG